VLGKNYNLNSFKCSDEFIEEIIINNTFPKLKHCEAIIVSELEVKYEIMSFAHASIAILTQF